MSAEPKELSSPAYHPPVPTHPDRSQHLLAQMTRNIRQTLDLETIWEQTVHGLGTTLDVGHAAIYPYEEGADALEIAAEFCKPGIPPRAGSLLQLSQSPDLAQAIATLRPMIIAAQDGPALESSAQPYACLAVATYYQDQPNGLIVLHQYDSSRMWHESDIDWVNELADQVGTAIAHAVLFAESQALTRELRQANRNLRDKHKELEEARKEAEEASRLKSEFLASMSHELRTPLNGMIGFLKLIMDGMVDDPEEQGEFISEAHNSAVHLLDIINDILDVAKIEAGKLELEMTSVKLEDVFNSVDHLTRNQAAQKGLEMNLVLPAARDDIILTGDYQRILQVLLNLVGNAIKFTHEGGVTISAEVIPKKKTFQGQEWPGVVKISVADTGIGVPLEMQHRLFQSFSQVDASRTRRYGGTGLGLVISQKLVEAMGGVVKFFSMGEGLGTTVTFTTLLYQEPVMVSEQPASSKERR